MDDVIVQSLGESCIGYFGAHGATQVRIQVDERRLTAKVYVTLSEDDGEHRAAVAMMFPEIRRMFIDDFSLEFAFEPSVGATIDQEAALPGVRTLAFA